MSWRPRGGASRRGRSAVTRPIYEDFKPTYEWKHEDGASILVYYLPGFSKEQIRIIAESKGFLKVRGERLIANNKWSRFQEEVVVPEDCNMSEVRAKFEGGNLRITMPKKTSTTTVDKKHPSSEDQRRPMNTALQGRGPPRSSVTTPSSVQPNNKPQLHELQEEMTSKPTTTLPPTIAPKLPQFGTTGIISPPTLAPSIGSQSEPQPKRQQEAAPTTLPMRLPPIDTLKQPKPYYQDNVYDKTNEKFVEDRRFHEEDYPTRIVGSKGAESVGRMAPTSHFRENEIKHKHKNDEATHHHGIQQEKHETYVDALDQERESKYDLSKMNNNKYDSYKQVMKTRLSKKSLDEDRKLLVNMGAAILVILALGASISYSLSSSE